MSAGQGIGARRVLRARGSALFVALCAVMGLLLGSSASALADEAPEAPQASQPLNIEPTSAVLEGTLNPGKEGAPGTFEAAEYFFLYDKSGSTCEGGGTSETKVSGGAGQEPISQPVEGLEGDTQYTACLVVRSLLEHKEAKSAPVSFRTPETPETLAPGSITSTSATLRGIVNPKGESEPGLYTFVYARSSSGCHGYEERELPAQELTGQPQQDAQASAGGLEPDTVYTVCALVYNRSYGDAVYGSPVTFTTPGEAPVITGETASKVAATSATVHATIAPGGLPTGYHVEYVSEAEFQANAWAGASRVPSSDAQLAGSGQSLVANEELPGLQPATGYRFRFVATNTLGAVAGTEAMFTTLPPQETVSALPDERAYELVSPPNEGEAYVPPAGEAFNLDATTEGFPAVLPFRVADAGNAVAWVGEPATSVGTGETGAGEGNDWLSVRTPNGWTSSDITPTGSETAPFQWFSSALSGSILEGRELRPATSSVPAGCTTLYARRGESETLTPLFSQERCSSPLFAGASLDESLIFFQDQSALTPNAQPVTDQLPGHGEHSAPDEPGQGCMYACNLYEASSGSLRLVNVLPGSEGHEGATVPNATFGGYGETEELTTFSHAISSDGSRAFWTDTQPGPDMGHIFVLENGAETVPVSGSGPAEYWTASPDGRYAFYTEAGELWRFDTTTRERVALTSTGDEAAGTADLTGPATGLGTTTEGSNIVTNVSTSSGAFVVGQKLVGTYGYGCEPRCIPEGAKITAVGAGTLTLSVPATESHEGFGIAAYSDEIDSLTVTSGQFQVGEQIYGPGVAAGTRIVTASAGSLTLSQGLTTSGTGVAIEAGGAEVQGVIGANETGEDGGFLYFVADGALAGTSKTTCSTTGSGCKLFLIHHGTVSFIATLTAADNKITFDAGHETGDWIANVGEHIASVTPDGQHLVFQSHQALTGYDNLKADDQPLLEVYTYSAEDGKLVCNSCAPSGAPPPLQEQDISKLPVTGTGGEAIPARFVSDNGNRVFFTTREPLSAQDGNDVRDVYEWEREGEGSCAQQVPARADGGCAYLLSGGAGQATSTLVGSDATGDNVFFEHVGPLGQLQAPDDHNLLFDARVKGGFPNGSLACTGTGCQGVPPAPPIFAAPATATFSGVGNVAPVPAGKPKRVVRPLTRAQKLAKALKACRQDKKQGKRVRCERQAHARFGVKKAKKSAKSRRAGNERRVQS